MPNVMKDERGWEHKVQSPVTVTRNIKGATLSNTNLVAFPTLNRRRQNYLLRDSVSQDPI